MYDRRPNPAAIPALQADPRLASECLLLPIIQVCLHPRGAYVCSRVAHHGDRLQYRAATLG